MQIYNASTSIGVGWLTDGIFDTGTEIQLTRVWSINAGYQHIWNPKWRTSIFGGYVNVSYNDTAKNIINNHLPTPPVGALACGVRSEERRVGQEGRGVCAACQYEKE